MNLRMSPLPLIRLDNPEAWSNVGVDYLGPILCKAECGGGGTNPCTVAEMDVIIMEIVSFVNEQPLGETNINDEDIPITPNMLATGRPLRQLRTPSTAIMESINTDKMWL